MGFGAIVRNRLLGFFRSFARRLTKISRRILEYGNITVKANNKALRPNIFHDKSNFILMQVVRITFIFNGLVKIRHMNMEY